MEKFKVFLKSKGTLVVSGLFLLLFVVTLTFVLINLGKSKETDLKVKSNDTQEKKDVNLAGNIAIADGEVMLMQDGENWETAVPQDTVRELTALKTGASSKAVIMLDDGSAIRMNENSEIVLKQLDPEKIIIDQISGEVYHRVEKDPSREYVVTSEEKNADYSVTALGTAFNVSGDGTSVKCLESAVKVVYAKDKPEELVEQGKEFVYDGEKGEVKSIKGDSLDNEWFKFNKEQDKDINANLGVFENEDAPSLTITAPANNSETQNSSVVVKGTTESGNTVKFKIDGNWTEVSNNDGTFEKEMSLKDGKNIIEVKTYNQAGLYTAKSVTVTKTTTPETSTSFKITSLTSPAAGKISVTWEMTGYAEKAGFKIAFSKNANPTYPGRTGDYYYYVSGGSSRSASFTHDQLAEGGVFNVRVCRYWAGESGIQCDIYTQNVAVSVAKKVTEDWGVPSMTLSGTQSGRTINLNWTFSGGLSDDGFKVVWSTAQNPTYPQFQTSTTENENKGLLASFTELFTPKPVYAVVESYSDWGYVYLSSPSARSASVTLSESTYAPGTYYFRVGRYRGGYCDYYSNQMSFTVE